MRYCVVWQDGWRIALLHGLLKILKKADVRDLD